MTAPNLSPQFSRGWNAGNCASPNVRDKLDQITTSALHLTWSKGIDSALRTPTCSSQTARRNLKSCRCVRGTIKKEANNGSPNETAENWARNEANLKKEEINKEETHIIRIWRISPEFFRDITGDQSIHYPDHTTLTSFKRTVENLPCQNTMFTQSVESFPLRRK